MGIEQLEEKLDRTRSQHEHIVRFLKRIGVTNHYCKKATEIVNRLEPTLEKRCQDLLKECGIYTIRYGFNHRVDFIKDTTYIFLGKCLGENLEDT